MKDSITLLPKKFNKFPVFMGIPVVFQFLLQKILQFMSATMYDCSQLICNVNAYKWKG